MIKLKEVQLGRDSEETRWLKDLGDGNYQALTVMDLVELLIEKGVLKDEDVKEVK